MWAREIQFLYDSFNTKKMFYIFFETGVQYQQYTFNINTVSISWRNITLYMEEVIPESKHIVMNMLFTFPIDIKGFKGLFRDFRNVYSCMRLSALVIVLRQTFKLGLTLILSQNNCRRLEKWQVKTGPNSH